MENTERADTGSEFEPVVVRCNHCGYMTEEIDIDACPNCGRSDAMMDMDIETIVMQNNNAAKSVDITPIKEITEMEHEIIRALRLAEAVFVGDSPLLGSFPIEIDQNNELVFTWVDQDREYKIVIPFSSLNKATEESDGFNLLELGKKLTLPVCNFFFCCKKGNLQ